jgi:hypothetical protein
MIRARWPLGLDEHDGRLVIGADGLPLQRAEPLVTHEVVLTAREALSKRTPKVKTRHNDPGLLLGVAFCAGCGAKLYVWSHAQKGRVYRYWRCGARLKGSSCSVTPVSGAKLEPWVINEFLSRIGDQEVVERVRVAGTDNSDQRKRLDDALETVRQEKDLGLYEGDQDAYLARVSALVAQRRQIPDEDKEAEWRIRGTGQTYGLAFVEADTLGKRALLLKSGVTVKASPQKFTIDVPPDIYQKLPGKTFGVPDDMSVPEAEHWLSEGNDAPAGEGE